MVRLLLAFSVVLIASQIAPPVQADEGIQAWMEYLAGDWQRESRIWTSDGGWQEESISWKGEIVAGGTTFISKGGGNWGDFVTVLGTDGHSGKVFEYGAAANGNRWRIMLETIESDKLAGPLLAGTGDGAKGEGKIEIVRKDDDAYEASWYLKLDNGTEMKGTGKNKRKSQ